MRVHLSTAATAVRASRPPTGDPPSPDRAGRPGRGLADPRRLRRWRGRRRQRRRRRDEAEAYPEDDITFVVPFSAGGPTDTVTRLVAEPMSEELGAPVVVAERRGCRRHHRRRRRSPTPSADGYTVLMHHIGMSTAPSLYPDLAYDPLEDFKTVGLVTEVPMTIVARQDFEPETFEELVAYLEENAEDVTLRQRRRRRRLPAVRPAAAGRARREAHRGALRGHRPGAHRPRRRSGRRHVRPDDQHDRPDPVRRDQGATR